MGYLFIVIAIFAGLIKGFFGKKLSTYVENYNDALFSNMLRMFLCILFGAVFVFADSNAQNFVVSKLTLFIAFLSGISTALFVFFWFLAVREGAYMTVDAFVATGIIIPLGFCSVLFDEQISAMQLLGIFILIVAVVVMYSYNNSIKEKLSFSKLCLLFLCGISSGMADFSQKLYIYAENSPNISVFNFYSYVFSFCFLFIVYIISAGRKKQKSIKCILKKSTVYILIMSVCLFLNSYFKTKAALYLPSILLYPLYQGLALSTTAVMTHMFFKEKISLKSICGIALMLVALIIINFL